MAENIESLKKEIQRLKNENDALKQASKTAITALSDAHKLEISSQDIDSILQEIDERDEKKDSGQQNANVYWVKIKNEMAVQDTTRIKEMILSGELTNNEHGRELLRSAAHFGCGDVVDTIKMHWKGITPDMYDVAIKAAEKSGNFHVANQLYFGKMGKEAKANSMQILETIKRQRAVNDYLCKQNDEVFLKSTLDKVMTAIKSRLPFSQDMLSLAWHYSWHYKKDNILDSMLWKAISQQMTDIISNMQTMQRDFLWLTSWLLQSVIFYIEIDGKPLFERANEIVNTKINKEATARLNDTMSQLKKQDNGVFWDALQEYGIEDDYIMISDTETESKMESKGKKSPIRQDNTGHPLKPEYNEHALRRLNASIGKTAVNMVDLYNETVYLGQIHMKNAILNDAFQKSVERLLIDLKKKDNNFNCVYSAGPIKKIERCLTKIDTKYIDSQFPSASNILDIARCTLIFNDMPSMLKALKDIEDTINGGGGYSIVRVVRKKNLFRDYNFDNPLYCDVKLNVEVFHKSVESISIVAEIQVMVQFMNTFKREISHKLYQIQRQQEHFEKMTKISKKLTEFEPNLTAILAKGHVKDLCKYMIEHIMDTQFIINYRFENGANIFHALFRFDNIGLYQYITRTQQSTTVTDELLRKKFEEKDKNGGNPFYELLKSNGVQIIDLFCKKFPDLINNFYDKRTHLRTIHYASYKGNPRLLDFVFEHAPKDPKKLDELIMSEENDGTTVFQWASNKGMLFAMKKLWQNLSDPNTKKEMLFGEQRRGRTPFYYTAVGNHLEAAKWLLSLCENDDERSKMVHHKVKSGHSIYEWMVEKNTFPAMAKQLDDWMKMYPRKS